MFIVLAIAAGFLFVWSAGLASVAAFSEESWRFKAMLQTLAIVLAACAALVIHYI